jgi:hypothetical protein
MRPAKITALQTVFSTAFSTICFGLASPAFAELGIPFQAGDALSDALNLYTPNSRSGLFVGPYSGPGLNATRARMFDPGLRLPTGEAAKPSLIQSGQASGALLGYRFDQLTLSSGLTPGLGASALGGTRFDVGASYGFNPGPRHRHLVTLSGGLMLGQSNAAVPYSGAFGAETVGPLGYRAAEPGRGFRLSWLYTLDRNLFFNTTLGFDRLQAEPTDGSLGIDRSATSVGTVFGYRW